MTAKELREAADAARTGPQELRARRDMLIRKALSLGWTQREVAEATGLTPGRIGQIAPEHDEGPPAA